MAAGTQETELTEQRTIPVPDQLVVALAQVAKNDERLERSHQTVMARLPATVLRAIRQLGAVGSKENATTAQEIWYLIVQNLCHVGAEATAERLLRIHIINVLERLRDQGRVEEFSRWPDHDPKCGVFYWVQP